MSRVFASWAESYDDEPNALLQLGDRVLAERLADLRGLRILDAGCGTGRWMRGAMRRGACIVGFDREPAMVERAPRGLVVKAEFERTPLQAGAFDLAIAAFSLSHAENPAAALADLSVAVVTGGRVVVADLHPDAVEAGWRRTVRVEGETVEIRGSVGALEAALMAPPSGWRIELLDSVRFGEAERAFFEADHWERVRDVWAVRFAMWRRVG